MDRDPGTSRSEQCRCLRRPATSRSRLPLIRFWLLHIAELNTAPLLHVIAGVERELSDDVAGNDRLAAESRVGAKVPRGIETVEFLVIGFAQVLLALPD